MQKHIKNTLFNRKNLMKKVTEKWLFDIMDECEIKNDKE